MRTILSILILGSLLAAGCVTPPEEIGTATTDPAAAPVLGTPTPYTFEGNFGPMLWVCPVVTCEGIEPSSQRWTELEIDGQLSAVSLTMTWDASTPIMETLTFGISWGENGEEWEAVTGTSPLVLEADDLNITSDDQPYLWTWTGNQVPMGLAAAGAPQDFRIEGDLTLVAEGAAPEADE